MERMREQFEAWWEINYHNGKPPRFGWAAWRDGDGYKIDDDDSELDGMWNAWQASRESFFSGVVISEEVKITDMNGDVISTYKDDIGGGES